MSLPNKANSPTQRGARARVEHDLQGVNSPDGRAEIDPVKMVTDFRAVFFPYCLDRQPDGTWLVLNREYQPLGAAEGWTDYKTHPSRVALKLTPAVVRKLAVQDSTKDRIYLYGDATSPSVSAENAKAYFAKLAILGKLELRYGF